MGKFLKVISVFFVLCLIFIPGLYADEISGLKEQIKKVQSENKLLQEKLNKQQEVIDTLVKKVDNLQAPSLQKIPEPEMPEESGEFEIPKLTLKGFADFEYQAKLTGSEDHNTFSLGEVDFFVTSKISEKVDFLTEFEFHPEADTNVADFHLERANIKYEAADYLNIKVGEMHTALGYWNQEFHHGSWLQTTINRPEIYKWEDDTGGFLPLHAIGIYLFGTHELNNFDLEYDLGVLNGRGKERHEIQNMDDKNNFKALSLSLSVKPDIIEGLSVGAVFYYDEIPENPSTASRAKQIDEFIIGENIVYKYENLELLAEFFNIFHDDKTSGKDYDTFGFYAQAGYKIDKITPYYRFDYIDFEQTNPYFTPYDIDIQKHTAGIRWDIFTWNALKFEYSYSDKKTQENEQSVTINTSFAF